MLSNIDMSFTLVLAAFFGLVIGSFLNVVIVRLPKIMQLEFEQCIAEHVGENNNDLPSTSQQFNLLWPASHCPQCKTPLRFWQNIPLLSYLWQRGRCTACQSKISVRYPLVECVTAIFSVFAVIHFGAQLSTLYILLFAYLSIALAFIDWDTQLLPDSLTYSLLWLGLIFNLDGGFTSLHSAVLGAVAGYLALWSIYWLFKLTTGKEGMGYGDFKLLAALGAWFGWQALVPGVLVAASIGLLMSVLMMLLIKHDHRQPIPFGPALVVSGFCLLFAKQTLVGWVLPSI